MSWFQKFIYAVYDLEIILFPKRKGKAKTCWYSYNNGTLVIEKLRMLIQIITRCLKHSTLVKKQNAIIRKPSYTSFYKYFYNLRVFTEIIWPPSLILVIFKLTIWRYLSREISINMLQFNTRQNLAHERYTKFSPRKYYVIWKEYSRRLHLWRLAFSILLVAYFWLFFGPML